GCDCYASCAFEWATGRLGSLRGGVGPCGEARFEVGEDVVEVLEADGETHEPGGDARGELLLGGQLRVRGRCRVDDEAAHVTDVGDVAVEGEGVDEGATRIHSAFELEGEHGAGALGGVLLAGFVPRARGQARVVHGGDFGLLGEPFGDGL